MEVLGGKLVKHQLWLNFPGVTDCPDWWGMGRRQSARVLLCLQPPSPAVGSHSLILGGLWVGPKLPPAPHTDLPSISAVSAVVLAVVGQEAVLVCEASGVPPPQVVWYRGMWRGEGGLLGSWRISFLEQSVGEHFEWGVWGEEAHFSSFPHCHPEPWCRARLVQDGSGVGSPWVTSGR